MTDWEAYADELAAELGIEQADEDGLVSGAPLAVVERSDIEEQRVVMTGNGEAVQSKIKTSGTTNEPEKVWITRDQNGELETPWVGAPRAVETVWVGAEGVPLSRIQKAAYLEAEAQRRVAVSAAAKADMEGSPLPDRCVPGPLDLTRTPLGSLPNGQTVSVLPTSNNTATTEVAVGAEGGDLVFEVGPNEIAETVLAFPEPVRLELSQAAEAGWFNSPDLWTITVDRGSLTVSSPDLSTSELPGGAGPELDSIEGEGTATVGFRPAATSGHIAPDVSVWTISTSEPVSRLTIRLSLANPAATNNQRSPIRLSAVCQ